MSNLKSKFENLNNAFLRLKEGTVLLQKSNDDLSRDGVIQRFEFTFELLWKTLKDYFEDEGIKDINSPKGTLKTAFSYGFIYDESIWLHMLGDRNLTSHIYSENLAIEICKRITEIYINEIEHLINQLSDRMN